MKKINSIILLITFIIMGIVPSYAQFQKPRDYTWTPPEKYVIDGKIDNMGYWRRLAQLGLVPVAPETPFNVTTYTGSEIVSSISMTKESTDVPTTTVTSTQSENSIVVDPLNSTKLMNSNNSTSWSGSSVGTLYGANYLYSTDSGVAWGGTTAGAGGSNSGDPGTGIDRNGRYYIGHINNSYGQSVSWSTNQGTTWTAVVAANKGSSQVLDKNHLWVDVCATSPYVNNIYNAWCPLGGSHPNLNNIEFGRSTNGGLNWSAPINISSAINAGSHNQGVNICTGPNGQVYAFWAVYDSWPEYEATYGFAKSTNGGASFAPATRFLTGCKGVRDQSSYFLHGIRTNSFPSSCCDVSTSAYSGSIYMVWANQGVPGVNTGNDIDIYLVKSTNQGTNWSTPIKVTTDPVGNGKYAWFPWITCDPANGRLSVVFYDDRNCTGNQAETWVANSTDGGISWDNFKVSDVAFTLEPIPGLAGGYMGDYLGITALEGNVYPCWSDNRSGKQITYVSPYTTGPPAGQPYVQFLSYVINDPTPGGNNNHQMDYNETNLLTLSVKNIGDTQSDNCNVVVSTVSPYITMVDNSELYGNVGIGATVTKTDAFSYTVAPNIPDGTQVIFVVTATDNSERTYVSNFVVEAHAPALSILNYTILDPLPGGNNNGKLDPNESADITFQVSNPGDWDILNAIGTLSTTNTNVTVTVPTYSFGNITSAQTKTATHHVTVAANCPLGSSVDLNYSVSGNSGNYTAQRTFNTKVGLIIEDWETNNFLKFPWVQTTPNNPWTITNAAPYEQLYCAKSGTIIDGGSSHISITRSHCANDSISFYKKVSSEENYDYLKFYIDGVMVGSWSGEVAWSRAAYPVTQGSHVFKWEYMKDGSVSNGSDCAWVDYIIFPAEVPDVVKEILPTNEAKLVCYPNPLNGYAVIGYTLEKQADVTIKVYNTFGKEVAPLLKNQITYAGTHSVIFNAKGIQPGMYFVTLTANGKTSTIKIVIN